MVFFETQSIPSIWGRPLLETYTVVLTSKLHCYNALYDVERGEEIYRMKQNILIPMLGNEKAVAFLTECSKYCYIISDMSSAHEHIMKALNLIKDTVDPHPRILIDSFRQATYIHMENGKSLKAKASIETALAICKHIVQNSRKMLACHKCHQFGDSLLFLDCMVDFAFYLGRTDQFKKCCDVLNQTYVVSLCNI